MEQNMSMTDKYVRMALALTIALLYFFGIITGTLALVLVIVGIIFALTSVVRFCPLYKVFGISTCRKD